MVSLMASFAAIRPSFSPAVPKTLEDLGISQGLVLDLMLRRLLLEGYSTLESLSGRLLLIDANAADWRTVKVSKDPACRVCS